MRHNFISGILKAPQSQDITHTGLPTLDEIIQGQTIAHKDKTWTVFQFYFLVLV